MENGSEINGWENDGTKGLNVGDLETTTWSWYIKCSNLWNCNQIPLSSCETLNPWKVVLRI